MLNSAEHETRPANKSQITNNYSNNTPPHNSRGVLWFHVRRPCVFLSVRPSVFRFRMINIDGFSPNLVCALILWRSGLGLLMDTFRQNLSYLPEWRGIIV